MSIGDIKDQERVLHQQVQTLKRRQERQLKGMEDYHQDYKAELNKTHTSEVDNLREENLRTVAHEAVKKERVLNEMKDHLNTTKQITDKELKALKDKSGSDRSALQERLLTDRDRLIGENELYLDEVNERYRGEVRNSNDEGRKEVHKMDQAMRADFSNQQGQLQKKINDQSQDFTARFQRDSREHKKVIDMTMNTNKQERIALNQRQQGEMAKMVDGHTHYIEKRDEDFRKGIKDQDVFFEKKYAISHAAHTKDANSLDERYNSLMNKMKLDLSKEMTKTTDRLDDPFYHFTELRPTWKRTEEGVEVKVKIPEYSKPDLALTTNGKEVILNFNRRYSDSNKSEDGTNNKVNKVETFTARVMTDIFLNPKTVKASFDGGVMTYTIKQA